MFNIHGLIFLVGGWVGWLVGCIYNDSFIASSFIYSCIQLSFFCSFIGSFVGFFIR